MRHRCWLVSVGLLACGSPTATQAPSAATQAPSAPSHPAVAALPAPDAAAQGWWEQYVGFSDRQKRAAERLGSDPVRVERHRKHRWPHADDMMFMPYADVVAACEADFLYACIGMSVRIDADGAPGEADVRGAKYAAGCAKGVMEDCFRAAELGADVALSMRACEHGIAIACFRAGNRLMSEFRGSETSEGPDAIDLFARGCTDDGALACNALAELYLHGSGIGKDAGQALRLYQRACDLAGSAWFAEGGEACVWATI